MFIRVGFEIKIMSEHETPLLLALSAHPSCANRIIGQDFVRTHPYVPTEGYHDEFGNRRTRLVAPPGELTLWSDFVVEDGGEPDRVNLSAHQIEISGLPSETLSFLTASRYCEVDELVEQAWRLFSATQPGWPRVRAICDFAHNHLTFGYRFGRPTKTAVDAYRECTGVCRDFAQLCVAFCRAMNIPARYASGYLGDIGVPNSGPGDFCAWFEAFLDGEWYTFDARYNTPRIGRVLMVRGRDAADVAMITSFGPYEMTLFRVWCDEIANDTSEENMLTLLEHRPSAPALTLVPSCGLR